MEVSADAIAYIAQNFPLTPAPAVPEIRVHKAGPASGLWRLADSGGDAFMPPYWSSWWGGGIALARYVLDLPGVVHGRHVLDLSCGLGLAGIAAGKAGASHVLALDVDPYAIAATRLNAAANDVHLIARLGDLRVDDPPDADVVLAGDVFYDPNIAAHSIRYLERSVTRGMRVLVGDPGRADLPRDRLQLIAEYDGADFATANARVSVFAFN